MKTILAVAMLSLTMQLEAFATWSILAGDRDSGRIVVGSATCLPQSVFPQMGAKDLRDIQAVVVPGKSAAVGQAAVDSTRRNLRLIDEELRKDSSPSTILSLLRQHDPAFESRQFGILDLRGRTAASTGKSNVPEALDISGRVGTGISYQIQGNMLAGPKVVHDAARAFVQMRGPLADRVMAAMEAADAAGGDRRCRGDRTAHVAYILVVEKDGKSSYISVNAEDVAAKESRNPVKTLRLRYDKANGKSR